MPGIVTSPSVCWPTPSWLSSGSSPAKKKVCSEAVKRGSRSRHDSPDGTGGKEDGIGDGRAGGTKTFPFGMVGVEAGAPSSSRPLPAKPGEPGF